MFRDHRVYSVLGALAIITVGTVVTSTLRGAEIGQHVAEQLMQKFFRPTER